MRNPIHARLERITSDGSELVVNGVKLSELVLRAGGTPFYAYDRTLIDERIRALREALGDTVRLHYAIKANPMPAVVGFVASRVDGLDVASACEMRVALDAGMPPTRISFAGPGKRPEELRAAIGSRICINVESELEIERAARISSDVGIAARIAIRVNPDFELKGSGMKMSGSPGQFGIDADRVPAAAGLARTAGLALEGLHIFCGSQNLNAESIIDANRQTLALAERLIDRCGTPMRHVNIGGGYGIPYFPGERDLDLPAVGRALRDLLADRRARFGDTEFIVELGRYLVGEAGYYVARVTDVKESRGATFAVADGGLHHHLANSGNFGQVLRKNYPVAAGLRLDEPVDTEVSVVGPLCTPLDKIADKVMLPRIEVGDVIVVFQSGAYGFTASPRSFLSHPEPVELLV